MVDAFRSSVYDEKTMKGTYGFDGFTYFKHEIMSIPKEEKSNILIFN